MNKKNRKKGLFSATAAVLVLIAAILVNVLVTKFDWSYDVSENQMYTLSEQTEKIVKANEKDVTLYVIASQTEFNTVYKKIVDQYKKLSSYIKVSYKDLENYPNFARDYMSDSSEEVEEGSIIAVCGEKSRYLSSADFINYTFDYTTYSYSAESVKLESVLTEAINYVIADYTPVIYTLTGHNEAELSSTMQGYLEGDNFEVKELNLLTEESVPEDCAILLINGPSVDFSKDETKKINTYLKGEGKLYYIANATVDAVPNLKSILKNYGITMEKGTVVEADTSMYMQYPVWILPTIGTSTVTESLTNRYVFVPESKGFTHGEDTEDYTITELLTTSDGAYSKVNFSGQVMEKEKGDIDGPFQLALQVEDENGGKVMVLGSSNVLLNEIDEAVSGSNSDFFLNGINYLVQQEEKISVRAKNLSTNTATVTAFAQKALMVGTVMVLPAVTLLLGLVVVLKRKRK